MKTIVMLGLAGLTACAPMTSQTRATSSPAQASGDWVEGVNFAREPGQPSIEEIYPDAAGMPRDVQAYIIRHSDCFHWNGEYSEEPARARQIADGIRQACSGVNDLGRRIRARHAATPAIVERLRGYEDVEE